MYFYREILCDELEEFCSFPLFTGCVWHQDFHWHQDVNSGYNLHRKKNKQLGNILCISCFIVTKEEMNRLPWHMFLCLQTEKVQVLGISSQYWPCRSLLWPNHALQLRLLSQRHKKLWKQTSRWFLSRVIISNEKSTT